MADLSKYLTTTISQEGVNKFDNVTRTLGVKSMYLKYSFWIIGLIVVVCLIIVIYDYVIAPRFNWPTVFLTTSSAPKNSSTNSMSVDLSSWTPYIPSFDIDPDQILYITRATYGPNDSSAIDVTSTIEKMIKNYTHIKPFTIDPSTIDPSVTTANNELKVTYQYGAATSTLRTDIMNDGDQFILTESPPPPSSTGDKDQSINAPIPPIITKLYYWLYGGGSGNLAPHFHDATKSVTIAGTDAPLSAKNTGMYGMQWWMYVKDWNYGYGKQKTILKRPDVTSSNIFNPNISLDATDNTMKISISIFPNDHTTSAKNSPAPSGYSGVSDDVFTCKVDDIPLQTWFSVSMTVFDKNLDIYINGKLVKSCLISGVPKPCVGDILLSPNGGFSGYICDFYHFPRMLNPEDALKFYKDGSACKDMTFNTLSGVSPSSAATGYSIKFGVYDTVGKVVQEYTF
jgi:hypothetical protein